ncbi:MAG: hypothetical protein J6P16_06770 [Eubacterium sp.]|nr:hypothetical protein [Eubacterium sp.]
MSQSLKKLCKRKYSKLEFEVDGFTDTFIPDEDNIPMSEFKISKVSIQKSLIGEKITGILANNSSKKTDNVSVAILMYKKAR